MGKKEKASLLTYRDLGLVADSLLGNMSSLGQEDEATKALTSLT